MRALGNALDFAGEGGFLLAGPPASYITSSKMLSNTASNCSSSTSAEEDAALVVVDAAHTEILDWLEKVNCRLHDKGLLVFFAGNLKLDVDSRDRGE